MRNKSRPRKRLIEDAHRASVKCVSRRPDPGLFDSKSQCFYSEKPCIDDKNVLIEKILKLLASSSLIYNTSVRHERHERQECNTSATLATRVQHKCDTNDTSAT